MTKSAIYFLFLFVAATAFPQISKLSKADNDLITTLGFAAKDQLLDKWYPLSVDYDDGGFYSEITFDFSIGEHQDKMIVTQARHVWTNAKAADIYPGDKDYLKYARHGFEFLRDKMWDKEEGGFFTLVTKQGNPILNKGVVKSAYGNSFAIYGLASYYGVSGDKGALELAKKTFYWLEEHSHDPVYKGYFDAMERNGNILTRTDETPSTSPVGYKDQNSSIHLLESLTSLYHVWPDPLVKERLYELLLLIRDRITTDKGYLTLYLQPDWTPLSFADKSKEEINKHYNLDHVSFGHDVETAYLMLEASAALGLKNDTITLYKGKKMVDHALNYGWDNKLGGFYDGGYYFEGDNRLTIVNSDKNWWSQAEGLNTLLLLSGYYPNDPIAYRKHFDTLLEYTQTYLMDPKYGGWYEWGLDGRPDSKTAPKGHIWKAAYHNFRALSNCVARLKNSGE